jgi:hypothetical protein
MSGVDQGGDGQVAAQLVQAAAAAGPDAAGLDAQPGADRGVGQGRVFGQQGDQLLAAWRQLGGRLAQRSVTLAREQLTFSRPGVRVGDGLGVGPRACIGHPAGPSSAPSGPAYLSMMADAMNILI